MENVHIGKIQIRQRVNLGTLNIQKPKVIIDDIDLPIMAGKISIDANFSTDSENPVQNKTITNKITAMDSDILNKIDINSVAELSNREIEDLLK